MFMVKSTSAFMAAWDKILADEPNQEIKKLARRKMRAGVPPAKFNKALNDWRNARTKIIKSQFKRELRSL